MAVQQRPRPLPVSLKPDALALSRSVLADIFGPPHRRHFTVRYWDGRSEGPPGSTPFTLVLKHSGALRRMLLPPTELNVGEAYLRDDYDVAGDLESAAALMADFARLQTPAALARVLPRLLLLPATGKDGPPERNRVHADAASHTRESDSRVVRFHYDVGNDFYALWLDKRMVYSCAYFRTGEDSLDEAQEAKLDHICRKLRLEGGDSLLDIGSGWGGLLIHAAKNYGVRGVGVTLSEPQAEEARRRISQAGLAEQLRIAVRDYRDLPGREAYDKIVSVGMVEHVGHKNLPEYFAAAYRLLRPGGLFLNHGIVHPRPDPPRNPLHQAALKLSWPYTSFVERYVFPGGELVTPGQMLDAAEAAGFETRDLESLREHYALTLRHWVRRLEAQHEQAAALVGEGTYRIWRLYMAAVGHAFSTGFNGIIQVLLAKPHADGRASVPLTREDIYQPRDAPSDWLQASLPAEVG